jgi:hypothetical protein
VFGIDRYPACAFIHTLVARLRPPVLSGGAILGGIAGSGPCKYGLQRYLPPRGRPSSLTNPVQSTTQPVEAAGEL